MFLNKQIRRRHELKGFHSNIWSNFSQNTSSTNRGIIISEIYRRVNRFRGKENIKNILHSIHNNIKDTI